MGQNVCLMPQIQMIVHVINAVTIKDLAFKK